MEQQMGGGGGIGGDSEGMRSAPSTLVKMVQPLLPKLGLPATGGGAASLQRLLGAAEVRGAEAPRRVAAARERCNGAFQPEEGCKGLNF